MLFHIFSSLSFAAHKITETGLAYVTPSRISAENAKTANSRS